MNRLSKKQAVQRLQDYVDSVSTISTCFPYGPEFNKWEDGAQFAIVNVFGKDPLHYNTFRQAIISGRIASAGGRGLPERERYSKSLSAARGVLEEMIKEVKTTWPDDASAIVASEVVSDPRKVFLVHGRDVAAKESVARFLEKLGLEPVILAERPNGGRTIIEKFEQESNVGYAIALFTPDDVGGLRGGTEEQARARQNVVFELGYFVGKLGRSRVCVLNVSGVEFPSDFSGVAYVPFDAASEDWKLGLVKELKAAGFDIDANKAFS